MSCLDFVGFVVLGSCIWKEGFVGRGRGGFSLFRFYLGLFVELEENKGFFKVFRFFFGVCRGRGWVGFRRCFCFVWFFAVLGSWWVWVRRYFRLGFFRVVVWFKFWKR